MRWDTPKRTLTLYIGNTLLQNLLKGLGVLKFFLDLGNNTLSQFPLLTLLDLALVSYPRIQHGLSLRG
jgi:hypothetical protein